MLALLRLQIENLCKIDREVMRTSLKYTSLVADQNFDTLCPVRSDSDAVRAGISYILSGLPKISHNGESLRIIRAEAKTTVKTKFKIDLHLQQRGSKVDYVSIGSFILDEYSLYWEVNPDLSQELFDKLPLALVAWTRKPDEILNLGKYSCFSADVRKICDRILIDKLVKLWAGTWLIASDESKENCHNLASILNMASSNSPGKISLNTLTIQETEENKKTLAAELNTSYLSRVNDMIEEFHNLDRASAKFASKVEQFKVAYGDLFNEADSIQNQLDQEFSEEYFTAISELAEMIEREGF
jgi:hypothetical protein